MRVAGIDLGKVRVGLAVSDELGSMAHPRPYLDGRNLPLTLRKLCSLAETEGVTRFIVGLPRSLHGGEGPPARRARRFAERLAELSGCQVDLFDEWLTTKEAQARLHEQGLDIRKSRARIDSAAASVMLQAWLERERGRGSVKDAPYDIDEEHN